MRCENSISSMVYKHQSYSVACGGGVGIHCWMSKSLKNFSLIEKGDSAEKSVA